MSMNDPRFVLQDVLAQDAWIRALAKRLVSDEHAAQEIAQDAWLRALETPPRTPGSAHSWLRRVVRNLAFLRHRTEVHRRSRESAVARQDRFPSVTEMRERERMRHAVGSAVFSLEEPYRTAILYRYFEDRNVLIDAAIEIATERKRENLSKKELPSHGKSFRRP